MHRSPNNHRLFPDDAKLRLGYCPETLQQQRYQLLQRVGVLEDLRVLEQAAREVGFDRLDQPPVSGRGEVFLNRLLTGRNMGPRPGKRFVGAKIEYGAESPFRPGITIECCQLNGPVLGKRHGAIGGAKIKAYATVQRSVSFR